MPDADVLFLFLWFSMIFVYRGRQYRTSVLFIITRSLETAAFQPFLTHMSHMPVQRASTEAHALGRRIVVILAGSMLSGLKEVFALRPTGLDPVNLSSFPLEHVEHF